MTKSYKQFEARHTIALDNNLIYLLKKKSHKFVGLDTFVKEWRRTKVSFCKVGKLQ